MDPAPPNDYAKSAQPLPRAPDAALAAWRAQEEGPPPHPALAVALSREAQIWAAFLSATLVWILSIVSAASAVWFSAPLQVGSGAACPAGPACVWLPLPASLAVPLVGAVPARFFAAAAAVGAVDTSATLQAGAAFLILAFLVALPHTVVEAAAAVLPGRVAPLPRRAGVAAAGAALAFALLGTVIGGGGVNVAVGSVNALRKAGAVPPAFALGAAAFAGNGLGCAVVAVLFAALHVAIRARLPADADARLPLPASCALPSLPCLQREAPPAPAGPPV
jgi:hypothetical protein